MTHYLPKIKYITLEFNNKHEFNNNEHIQTFDITTTNIEMTNMNISEMTDTIIPHIKDPTLAETIQHGVAYYHSGIFINESYSILQYYTILLL